MARKVRISFPGACYHIINRGNYRAWIFDSEGARHSFLEVLQQTCVAKGWSLYAWVLMSNHYHLCIKTSEPNLVDGMRWMQSTFANRFNRFRNERGHVFQGRYQSILLDADAVDTVCHYIHLNPVRAGMVEVDHLEQYAQSSFAQLWYPSRRWSCFEPTISLSAAGGLEDSRSGRKNYRTYLAWLTETDVKQKQLGFDTMCRGWCKGSPEFRKQVVADLEEFPVEQVVESETASLREFNWEKICRMGLSRLGKKAKDVRTDRKGAPWKVALARFLREQALAPNLWISKRLQMGRPSSVQSLVSRHRQTSHPKDDP